MRCFDPVWRLNLIATNLKNIHRNKLIRVLYGKPFAREFSPGIQMFPHTKFWIQSCRTRHERLRRVTLSNLSRSLSRNVKKKDFRIALQGMLHQAICPMQLAMIIIKNSIKTASANVWRHIDSQKPIGSHSVYKHCETDCKRDVTLCNALKMRCSVAAIVAKSIT